MSEMPPDPQGEHEALDTWDEQLKWFLKLLDIHHGEAVLMPLRRGDIPWK